MNTSIIKPGHIIFLSLLIVVAAIFGGYYLAGSKNPALSSSPSKSASGSPAGAAGKAGASAPQTPGNPPAKWVPPEGDPVERYRAAKGAQERQNVISNFMALGHDRNAAMLIAALNDADLRVQMFAIESSTSLEAALAHQVLTQACVNKTADVRQMAWSLLAPYGINEKAATFAQVLIQGPDDAFTEAFQEMSISPERPLFETMLNATLHADAKRVPRLLTEMQEWLERAGEVPKFKSAPELLAWWGQNQKHYDQYLLRLD